VGLGKVVALGIVGLFLGVALVLVVIVGVLMVTGVTHVYRVADASMEPVIRDGGDHVFSVEYLFAHPGRSDIVAFHAPRAAVKACGQGGVYVQRIVGLPGETFQEQHGRVYIDGELLREPYIQERDTLTRPRVRIPARAYYVLGDNRKAACDSRKWGPLPRKDIVGRVIATYWPLSRIAVH
jgi:signal peptidase I